MIYACNRFLLESDTWSKRSLKFAHLAFGKFDFSRHFTLLLSIIPELFYLIRDMIYERLIRNHGIKSIKKDD